MSGPRELALYAGTTLIGTIVGGGRAWLAFTAAGNPLPGEFASQKAAVAAINNQSSSSSCVADDDRRDNGG